MVELQIDNELLSRKFFDLNLDEDLNGRILHIKNDEYWENTIIEFFNLYISNNKNSITLNELKEKFRLNQEDNTYTIIVYEIKNKVEGYIILEHGLLADINCVLETHFSNKELDLERSVFISNYGVSNKFLNKVIEEILFNYVCDNYGTFQPLYLETYEYDNELDINLFKRIGFIDINTHTNNHNNYSNILRDSKVYMIRNPIKKNNNIFHPIKTKL